MIYLSDLPEDGRGETFFPSADAPPTDDVRCTFEKMYCDNRFIVQVRVRMLGTQPALWRDSSKACVVWRDPKRPIHVACLRVDLAEISIPAALWISDLT